MHSFVPSWLLLALLLTGCAGPNASANLPRGAGAYTRLAPASPNAAVQIYRIGPLDSLDISVFGEPDLSAKAAQVDAAGNISLPLIGTVAAAGATAAELSAGLERRLGAKYLERPQVTVSVAASVSQRVVVEGEVTEPGVYDLKGPTTLLGVLALAKGETRTAALKEVLIFRNIDGQRVGGVFDASLIRRGDAQDPPVFGSDLVVVGYSNAKGFWRDLLQTAPLLNTFAIYGR